MISAYYVNDKASGYECFKRIIFETKNDYSYFKSAVTNLKYYDKIFKADSDENILDLFYAYDNQVYNLYKNISDGKIDEHIIQLWNTLFVRIRHLLTKPNSNFSLDNTNTNNTKQIIITFTTCKRLDLFKQTINSILNHWTDINKID